MNTLMLLPSHGVEREAPDAGSARLRCMAQLDSLRGLAVIMVLFQHAIPPFGKIFPVAHAGVILFFVLRGFLITSILLADHRDADSDGGQNLPDPSTILCRHGGSVHGGRETCRQRRNLLHSPSCSRHWREV